MRLMTSQKVKKATNQKECCNTTPAQQHSLCVKNNKLFDRETQHLSRFLIFIVWIEY